MSFEQSFNQSPSTETIEHLPLRDIKEIHEGEPSSFIVYHGSNTAFAEIIPNEEHPVVFYSSSPAVAASYAFGNYRFGKINTANDLAEKHPVYTYEEMVYGAKLLNTTEQDLFPEFILTPQYTATDSMRINTAKLDDRNFEAKEIRRVQEKLQNDPEFRKEARKLLDLRLHDRELVRLDETEIVDNEMGPTGATREYMVTAKNPAVFDYGGKTWGWFPDPENPGQWWQGDRRTPVIELRKHWDEWLESFFRKGHDVVIVQNIIDIGHELNRETSRPQTIAAVSSKAHVEMNSTHRLKKHE